jgi:phenylacetate-CoA ligase
MIPLLRYRTADLVVKVPHTATTSGRTWDLYQGGILGRVDDMKLVRGTNVYPRTVESIVRGVPEIEEFQIELVRADIRDEIILHVELVPGVGETRWTQIHEALRHELADAHEGLQFQVERADEGSLPRFELKARRLTDRRPTASVPTTTARTAAGPTATARAAGVEDADARRRGETR